MSDYHIVPNLRFAIVEGNRGTLSSLWNYTIFSTRGGVERMVDNGQTSTLDEAFEACRFFITKAQLAYNLSRIEDNARSEV